jgi:hypothetical protein
MSDMTPAERELDEIGPVAPLSVHESERWGVAVVDSTDGLYVERYADYEAAEAASLVLLHMTRWYPQDSHYDNGKDWVHPMVVSRDGCNTWYLAATGWEVPQ